MSNQFKEIETLYDDINTQVFTINQTDDYHEITRKIITLAERVHAFEDESLDLWSIGEGGESSLDNFIVGAYWHFTEWHSGQSSSGYEALSRLGEVYQPNMESAPTEEDSGYSAYDQLNTIASGESHHV